MLARQRYLQEKKRMIILDESRAEEQARKEAGLARIEKVADARFLSRGPRSYCTRFSLPADRRGSPFEAHGKLGAQYPTGMVSSPISGSRCSSD